MLPARCTGMRVSAPAEERIASALTGAEFFKGHHSAEDLIKYMKGFVVRKPLHEIIYRSVRSGLSALKRRICR